MNGEERQAFYALQNYKYGNWMILAILYFIIIQPINFIMRWITFKFLVRSSCNLLFTNILPWYLKMTGKLCLVLCSHLKFIFCSFTLQIICCDQCQPSIFALVNCYFLRFVNLFILIYTLRHQWYCYICIYYVWPKLKL